jgi:hypothetical protein
MLYIILISIKYKNLINFAIVLIKLEDKPKCTKDQFIDLVKLTYELNPMGKGKNRKRTLDEVLYILKNVYPNN